MKNTSLNTKVIVFIAFQYFVEGMENYLIIPTAWYYIHSLGGGKAFLGFVMAVHSIGAMLAGPLIGHLADKFSGRVKHIILLCYVLKVVGNLIYSIPVSMFYPLIGRLISGIGVGCQGVLRGQILLYTPKRYRSKMIVMFEGMYIVGGGVGPALGSFIVLNVDVFGWKIGPGNSPGVILLILWLVGFVAAALLPKTFGSTEPSSNDYVDGESSVNLEEADIDTVKESNETRGLQSISTVLCLYYFVFISMAVSCSVAFYTPLFAESRFHLSLLVVKFLFLVSAMFSTALFLSLYCFSQYFDDRHSFMSLMSLQATAIVIQGYFGFFWEFDNVNQSYLLLFYISFGMDNFTIAFTAVLLARVTPPEHPGFYQGLLEATSYSGYVVGRLISGFMFEPGRLAYYSLSLAMAWIIGAVWFCVEYQQYTYSSDVF